MADAGIPDFGVGVSINGGAAVPFVSVPVSPGTDVSVGYNTSTGKVGIGNNSNGFQQFYYPRSLGYVKSWELLRLSKKRPASFFIYFSSLTR